MREEYDFSDAARSALIPTPGKTRITIRIDNDILEWFRDQVESAGGGSYQVLINNALREHMSRHGDDLETMIRRVVRDELALR